MVLKKTVVINETKHKSDTLVNRLGHRTFTIQFLTRFLCIVSTKNYIIILYLKNGNDFTMNTRVAKKLKN